MLRLRLRLLLHVFFLFLVGRMSSNARAFGRGIRTVSSDVFLLSLSADSASLVE